MIVSYEKLEEFQKALRDSQELLTDTRQELTQLRAAHAAALNDLEMSRNKLVAVMESRPLDPIMAAQMLQAERTRLAEARAKQRMAFQASLKTMPMATVINDKGHDVIIGINGTYRRITANPPVNSVEAVFADEWEQRWIAEAALEVLINNLSCDPDNGKPIPHANKMQRILGSGAKWNDSTASPVSVTPAELYGG